MENNEDSLNEITLNIQDIYTNSDDHISIPKLLEKKIF